jgi:hypothetical protein
MGSRIFANGIHVTSLRRWLNPGKALKPRKLRRAHFDTITRERVTNQMSYDR